MINNKYAGNCEYIYSLKFVNMLNNNAFMCFLRKPNIDETLRNLGYQQFDATYPLYTVLRYLLY